MSEERALLEKILNTGWLNHELSCEAEELLAQPEQEAVEDRIARWHRLGYEQGKKASQREPLSEDKLDVLAEANITDEGIAGYYLGFRDAEKHHGIGGGM